MTKRIDILNTHVDVLNMEETMTVIENAIHNGQQLHHVAINAGKIVAMQHDETLRESVNAADVMNADGQAVVWASKFLGKPLPERVAGIDLMQNLVELAHNKGYKIYLLGAKQEIIEKMNAIYAEKYNDELVVGYRNGYFNKAEEAQVAQEIANTNANMLFVAITSPKKENFLYAYKEVLKNINFIMGVGGSFDVISGKTTRAPLWMQNIGIEWFYRFLQEPKRMWKRYLVGNTKFILLVLKARFRGN